MALEAVHSAISIMKQGSRKFVAIVQARMGSTRLPGKVLMPIGNETVLEKVVRRLSRASSIDVTVVATTQAKKDDVIVEECNRLGVQSFRGSEDDVLDRYYRAAEAVSADVVIRITSDCPLIDPEVVDEVASKFVRENADFACNALPRTYPRGLDTEIFTMDVLARLWQAAHEQRHREHVTLYCYEHRDLFQFVSVVNRRDWSHHRWTVDTPEDLELVRVVYEHFNYSNDFSWRDALAFLERSPQLMKLNAHIRQKVILAEQGARAI